MAFLEGEVRGSLSNWSRHAVSKGSGPPAEAKMPLPRQQTVQRLTTQTLTFNDDASGAWLLVYW